MQRHIIFRIIFIVPLLTFFSMSCDKDSTTEPKTETIILTKITGDNQQGVQGDTLSTALAVLVTDKDGKAVSGKQIDFKIKEGKGTLSAENINTDENGQASVILILGDQQGKVTVEVKISGTNISTTFTAIVGIHKPYSIEIASGDDQWACPGETLPKSLQVVVKDEWSRPFEGAVVTFSIDEGTGSLSALSDTTSVSGIAQTILTFSDTIGKTKVIASLQGVDSSTTVTFTSSAIIPTIEIFSGNDQYGDLGDNLPKPLKVTVVNTRNEPMGGIIVNFEIIEGSGTLSALTDTTNVLGLAQSSLTLIENPGKVSVSASIHRFEELSTVKFIVTGVPHTIEIIIGNNQLVFTGEEFTQPLQVQLKNYSGIKLEGVLVSFKVVEGDGLLFPEEVTTNENGIVETILIAGNAFGDIRITATAQGVASPVEFYNGVSSPSRIAFIKNEEIYTMNTDGSSQVRLTNNWSIESSPSWSPDGTKIAYSLSGEIYVMNSDGSNQICITGNSTNDTSPSWSPDGTKIAFVSDGYGYDIYIMHPDGSNKINITNINDKISNHDPSWSPDGGNIVFVSVSGISFAIYSIYVMNSDGSNPIKLADLNGRNPSWSPDGSKIAFSGEDGIYTMNADGSNKVKLTDKGFFLSWSPDGNMIVFSGFLPMVIFGGGGHISGKTDIYIMNADGSNVQRIAEGSSPAWSPILSW